MSLKVITPHPKKPMPWLVGRDWPELWRVRLADKTLMQEKSQWCRDNVASDKWGKNFGGEVFYFVNLEDATAFRLRWEGASK